MGLNYPHPLGCTLFSVCAPILRSNAGGICRWGRETTVKLQRILAGWGSAPLTPTVFKGQLSSLLQTILLCEVESSHVILFNPEFSTNLDFTCQARRAHLFFNYLCCILSCFGLASREAYGIQPRQHMGCIS